MAAKYAPPAELAFAFVGRETGAARQAIRVAERNWRWTFTLAILIDIDCRLDSAWHTLHRTDRHHDARIQSGRYTYIDGASAADVALQLYLVVFPQSILLSHLDEC